MRGVCLNIYIPQPEAVVTITKGILPAMRNPDYTNNACRDLQYDWQPPRTVYSLATVIICTATDLGIHQ